MLSLTETFAALGDPTRFAIVERLLQDGELSAGDISDGIDISAPAILRHHKISRKAGVLEQRIDKQKRIYSIRGDSRKPFKPGRSIIANSGPVVLIGWLVS